MRDVVLINIEKVEELEYRGHTITKVEPERCFYLITQMAGQPNLNEGLQGKWGSPQEAMAAIDDLETSKH